MSEFDELLSSVPHGAWIGGESRPSSTGATFEIRNPANDEVLARVADATVDDARSDCGVIEGCGGLGRHCASDTGRHSAASVRSGRRAQGPVRAAYYP